MKFKVGDRIIEKSVYGKEFRIGTVYEIVIFSLEYRQEIMDVFKAMQVVNEVYEGVEDKLEDYYKIQWDNGEQGSLGHPSCYQFTTLYVDGNDLLKELCKDSK